jgi:rod shape-determining protein MreC
VNVVYKNRIVIGAVLVIIIFFVMRPILRSPSFEGQASILQIVASCCLYPLLKAQQLVVEPVARWKNRSDSVADLEKNMSDLQKKYEHLCSENIALKALCQYADETDELRIFNKRYALQKGCVAQVLARHFSSNNQFFLVDVGSVHGIKKDMVALYGNAIVGRVAEVYPWYCKVSLITDADCKVAVLCALFGEKGYSANKSLHSRKTKTALKSASGIHEGINDATCTSLRYVSHLEQIHAGDDVLSSGEGLVFPKGFLLGKVISAEKGELFYTIAVQPALDFHALRYCTLIAKEDI